MFHTSITGLDSGYERRSATWMQVRCQYNAIQGVKDETQMGEIRSFFMNRCGRAFGFRFKDWSDYTIQNQLVGTGDGKETDFQIVKTYTSTEAETGQQWTFDRLISKIAWGTVTQLIVDGTTFTVVDNGLWNGDSQFIVDHNSGIISFASPPTGDIILPYAEFHVPVRFDTDFFNVNHEAWIYTSVNSLPLIEVRDYITSSDESWNWDYGDFDLGTDPSPHLVQDFGDFDNGYNYSKNYDFGDFG